MAKPALKRTLSLPVLTLYGLGNILGAGIYVLVGKVTGAAGFNAPMAFVIAMIIAGLTAFSYMELSSRFPKSAGSSLYTYQAFKQKWLSIIVGLTMILAGMTSAATLAHGFAGYLGSLLPVPPLLTAVVLIVLMTGLVIRGVGESAKVAAIFTIIEIIGLLLIIGFGVLHLGEVSPEQIVTLDPTIGISGLLLGAFLAFYAFIGFEDMVNVAEEVKRPERVMPMAILISLITGTILYLLVVLVSVASTPPALLAESSAPLTLVLERVSSIDPRVITLIGMAAALNGVIVQLIMASRMLYGLSSQGWITKFFARIDPRRHTPVIATLVVAVLALVGVLFPIQTLASATSFLVLMIFCLVNLSLIVVKRRDKKPNSKTLHVPLFIPILGALSSAAIVIYQAYGFLA